MFSGHIAFFNGKTSLGRRSRKSPDFFGGISAKLHKTRTKKETLP
jgi:hypothetical protein